MVNFVGTQKEPEATENFVLKCNMQLFSHKFVLMQDSDDSIHQEPALENEGLYSEHLHLQSITYEESRRIIFFFFLVSLLAYKQVLLFRVRNNEQTADQAFFSGCPWQYYASSFPSTKSRIK